MCHDATGTVGLSQESALAIVLNCALSIVYVDATSASHHNIAVWRVESKGDQAKLTSIKSDS